MILWYNWFDRFLKLFLDTYHTVEPVYNGYPRDLRNWPLNTGGRLIQDHLKNPLGVV